MSHVIMVRPFFSTKRDGNDLNLACLTLNDCADHVEDVSTQVGCSNFIIPPVLRRAFMISIALSHDPAGIRLKAIEKLIIQDPKFSTDEMLEYIKRETVQYYDLRPNQVPPKIINNIKSQDGGSKPGNHQVDYPCTYYNSPAGCNRPHDCRFEHRIATPAESERMRQAIANRKQKGKEKAEKGRKDKKIENKPSSTRRPPKETGSDGKCYQCGQQGHTKTDCPVQGAIKCAFCDTLGHTSSACEKKKRSEKQLKINEANVWQSKGTRPEGGEAQILVLQMRQTARPPSKPTVQVNSLTSVSTSRILVDSGADCFAIKDEKLVNAAKPYQIDVGTCDTSNKLVTQGKDDVVMELPSGVNLEVNDAIFSKGLSHSMRYYSSR